MSAKPRATVRLFATITVFVLTIASCASARSEAPKGVSAQQMVHLLQSQLPPGELSGQQGHGLSSRSGPAPSAQLLFGSNGNAAKVSVKLNRWPVPVPVQYAQCPDTTYHPYSHCTQTVLPTGARLVLDRSPSDEDHPSAGELLSALLTYEDGRQVFVSETGRPTLPLTHRQLAAVATSSRWNPVLAAMPEPSAPPRSGSVSRLTAPEINRILQRLLPAGVRAGRPGGADGFGHLAVDDGHGKSLVAVNVQRWRPGDAAMTQVFRNAVTLPDGTRVSTRRGPAPRGGAGAIEWTVDTLGADGLRVVISTLNAGAYRLPADRSAPALTLEQLQRIALDPAWRRATG
ncbi:hypothetical protein [Actinomadura decatromicini]|uniref:Uncharacterized protein n=1 Tax=Actinomadura decatromicini TaxID=2604572 RepID=A0A5D3FWD3_9ACTN|nr:hypothetical protein [Actinomadura decatromicini]TYK52434.1 hypothetical protein FXF68_01215 [Actinomadura decatromicini]